jgi:hypothetical protein
MESERESLIEKLVTTGHLNVPERLSLGSGPLKASEIAAIVIMILKTTGTFPRGVKSWRPGLVVDERAILQSLPDGKLRLIQQRANPIDTRTLAQEKVTDFDNVESAVGSLMKIEWGNGIDGIPIHFAI